MIRADKTFASMPLVVITAESEMSDLVKIIETGADGYLLKPWSKNTFSDTLKKLRLEPHPPAQD